MLSQTFAYDAREYTRITFVTYVIRRETKRGWGQKNEYDYNIKTHSYLTPTTAYSPARVYTYDGRTVARRNNNHANTNTRVRRTRRSDKSWNLRPTRRPYSFVNPRQLYV